MSTRVPSTAASIPVDKRNTAPQTRARYRYQDECAAIALLNHLGSEDLEGVLIEHSTDLILLPIQGVPELVSIKHREPNQSGESGWSWQALKRQRVLSDLYNAWVSAGRHCTLAFWTNGGFNGSTYRLWKVCTRQAEPTQDLLRSLVAQLNAPHADIEAFLAALTIPEDPLPRRKEATDIGIRRTADLIEKHRPGPALHAEHCYRALVDRIARAGTDVPEAETLPRSTVAATLGAIKDHSQIQLSRRFLNASELLRDLLYVNDCCAAASLPNAGQHGWEPDAQFIGRSKLLSDLDELLRPGLPLKVAPVVIHGIPGCGKTSVAAQFAATHKAVLRPIFINASSRVALINELAILTGGQNVSEWDRGIAQLRGPVTPRLPGNSATLLIIDGVTDPDIVHGIVPRESLCRVIITSTVSYVEQGYKHIELEGWSRDESHEFISTVLNNASREDREKIARALSDNPLALTQAVNYCRLTERSISDYLVRLAREPLMVLDRGRASGHVDSIGKAITINIGAAEERFPGCTELLYLLSHLGGSPIDESILEGRSVIAFVREPEVRTPTEKRVRWGIGTRSRRQAEQLGYATTKRGHELFQCLGKQAWRDQAIEVLLLTSLITRRDEGLIVHPLVALVARNLGGDPRPWLEVGIGLFASYLESGRTEDFTELDRYIDHVAALGSTALDAELDGPAVLAVCQILSNRLSMLGTSRRCGERTSVHFGQRAVEIAERSLSTPRGSPRMLAEMRRGLVTALWETGRADEAIMHLRQNLRLGREHADEQVLIGAILDIGLVAAEISQRQVAEEALRQIDVEIEDASDKPLLGVSVGYVKARLLRRLGRIDEAQEVNDKALALARELPDCPDRVLHELHGNAGLLARDLGHASTAYLHEMAALEIIRRNVRDRPDMQDVKVLSSAADAAIDAGRLDEANQMITEADRGARAEFGVDSQVYARVLATRGRLRFVEGNYRQALGDLERAATMLRDGSERDRIAMPAVLVHLAQIAQAFGDQKKAWGSIEEAYRIDLDLYGPDHPEARKDEEIMNAMKLMDLLAASGKSSIPLSRRG
jgi:tetratricopeptide (TPR) repeat protein